MAQLAELDTAPDTIEATLNYIVSNGEKLFTQTGGPGSLDVRTGGTPDPRQMPMHNGRGRDFALDRRRLPLRAPRHQGERLLRRG